MSTMAKEAPGRRRRRIHSEDFKASVVLASQQPGVSMASVALANGLNATMLRRWVVQAERGDYSLLTDKPAESTVLTPARVVSLLLDAALVLPVSRG
ncbi:MAG: transposase, partial [Pseudomonadota bacterium]